VALERFDTITVQERADSTVKVCGFPDQPTPRRVTQSARL